MLTQIVEINVSLRSSKAIAMGRVYILTNSYRNLISSLPMDNITDLHEA